MGDAESRRLLQWFRRRRWPRFLPWHGRVDAQSGEFLEDPISRESGQALIEAAIALPILAAFLFTMIELCLVFYSYNLSSELAREGTRYAIVHGATCLTSSNASCTASATAINSYVSHLGWPNLGGGTITPATSFPDGNENPGNRVQVQVTYVFPVDLPFVPQSSISMKSSSVMYFIQ